MRYMNWIPWLLTAASFAVTGLVAAQASSTPSRIYVVEFMKVEPGGEDDYVAVETDWWKPVHAERIRRGSMHSWSLYRVRYPDGVAKEYDFVTVNVFDSFADSERDPFALLAEVHPGADTARIEEETMTSRRMVRGEIWYRLDHLE
jgi:hypothetical protein